MGFAGIFAGNIGALRGRIVRMNECAVRAFTGCGEVTLSPFAGFIE